MHIVGYIASYIIIPFVVYGINDLLAGYFHDRIKDADKLSVYEDKEIVFLAHIFWPLYVLFIPFMWSCTILSTIHTNLKASDNSTLDFLGKFSPRNFYKIAKEKREKELDLDYQAEKHLTGSK